jgi:hypothetical protein
MDNDQKEKDVKDRFTVLEKILGSIVALIVIIGGISGFVNSRDRIFATVESSVYSLPFEVRNLIENLYTNDFDSLLKSSIIDNSISKNDTLNSQNKITQELAQLRQFQDIKSKIIEKLKLDFLSDFSRYADYSHIIIIKNKGKKVISNLKIIPDVGGGYYQYIDNEGKAHWGTISNAILISSLEPKSSVSVMLLSRGKFYKRKDIKIYYPDNVIYPKLIYGVKGFWGRMFSNPILLINIPLVCFALFAFYKAYKSK